jgi:hypothetical protein
VIIQRVTLLTPVVINRIQNPAPEARREADNIVPLEVHPEPHKIVERPLNPVEEPDVVYTITEEFEVLSAATTPPQLEAQISSTPPVDQSPRAKALAEALFGGETISPAVSPPRINHSAEELRDEVERKVLAITTALKSHTRVNLRPDLTHGPLYFIDPSRHGLFSLIWYSNCRQNSIPIPLPICISTNINLHLVSQILASIQIHIQI